MEDFVTIVKRAALLIGSQESGIIQCIQLFRKLSAYQVSQKISYHKVAILSNKSNEWALSGMTHGLRIPNILHISTPWY